MAQKGTINDGVKDYQEKQRKNTCEKIHQAVLYLRSVGMKVTRKAIANEVGISSSAMRAQYIKDYLLRYVEFNPALAEDENDKGSKEKYERDIKILNDEISNLKYRVKQLKADNTEIRGKYNELVLKYKRVLGTYQLDHKNDITPF